MARFAIFVTWKVSRNSQECAAATGNQYYTDTGAAVSGVIWDKAQNTVLYSNWVAKKLYATYDNLFDISQYKQSSSAGDGDEMTVDTENGCISYTQNTSEGTYSDSNYQISVTPGAEYKLSYKLKNSDDELFGNVKIEFFDNQNNSVSTDNSNYKGVFWYDYAVVDGAYIIYFTSYSKRNLAEYVFKTTNSYIYASLANKDIEATTTSPNNAYMRFKTPNSCTKVVISFGVDSAQGETATFSDINLSRLITYSLDDSDIKTKNINIAKDGAVIDRPGYAFTGWKINNAGDIIGDSVDLSSYTNGVSLTSQWTKIANDDVFVMDFGTVATMDVTSNDYNATTYPLASVSKGSSKGFNVEVVTKDGKNVVKFTPTEIISTTKTFTYTTTANAKGEYGIATVTIIPANNVYYEEDNKEIFEYKNSDNLIWEEYSEGGNSDDEQAVIALKRAEEAGVFGGDESYEATGNLSMCKAMKLTVSNEYFSDNYNAYVQFTFTGTGFDVNSIVSNETGFFNLYIAPGEKYNSSYEVYNPQKPDSDLYTQIPCNTYNGLQYVDGEWKTVAENDGIAIYQVPVISKTDLPYGTYTVRIYPAYSKIMDIEDRGSYDFYLDSVKIYNPINDEDVDVNEYYKQNNEFDVQYLEIRDELITSGTITGKTPGVAFLGTLYDGKDYTEYIEVFESIGPNNEVYLAPNQAISFDMVCSGGAPARVAVGSRKLATSADTVAEKQANAELTIYGNSPSEKMAFASTTDMFRELKGLTFDNGTSTVIIENTGNVNISLTKLKISYNCDEDEAENHKNSSVSVSNRSAVGEPEKTGRNVHLEFNPEHFRDVAEKFLVSAPEEYVVDSDGVIIKWSTDKIKQYESATLTVKTGENIVKVEADGKAMKLVKTENGEKTWEITYTEDNPGVKEVNIKLTDENEMKSENIKSGKLTIRKLTFWERIVRFFKKLFGLI